MSIENFKNYPDGDTKKIETKTESEEIRKIEENHDEEVKNFLNEEKTDILNLLNEVNSDVKEDDTIEGGQLKEVLVIGKRINKPEFKVKYPKLESSIALNLELKTRKILSDDEVAKLAMVIDDVYFAMNEYGDNFLDFLEWKDNLTPEATKKMVSVVKQMQIELPNVDFNNIEQFAKEASINDIKDISYKLGKIYNDESTWRFDTTSGSDLEKLDAALESWDEWKIRKRFENVLGNSLITEKQKELINNLLIEKSEKLDNNWKLELLAAITPQTEGAQNDVLAQAD